MPEYEKSIELPDAGGVGSRKCSRVEKISPSITSGDESAQRATSDAGRDFLHEWAFSYFRQASGVGKLYSFIVVLKQNIMNGAFWIFESFKIFRESATSDWKTLPCQVVDFWAVK